MTFSEKKEMAAPDVTFVHSLFRSGSTYIYNALKRTGKFHIYHEPMHEVIASLSSSWDDLADRKEELKSTFRHDFLEGGYFDEFSELLPGIKQLFDAKFSFDYYFLNAGEEAADMKAYIDLLKNGLSRPPVLQCTRTSGRIDWLKENYESNHVFLLRNPWDQWYSYKVDPYIANTPRVIYSQSNAPEYLKAVFAASGALPLIGCNTQEKVEYGYEHPLTPEEDYFLFFGLWLHSFICGERGCDVFIDMDELSASEGYRVECLAKLEKIGIQSINFSDVKLHRTVFDGRELADYCILEEQVLDIFLQHGISVTSAKQYIEKARQVSFPSAKKIDPTASGLLEDAFRMRKLLVARDGQIASLNQSVTERDGQIASLNQSVTERDGQIASLNQSVTERDGQIASLNQSVTERDGQIASLNQSVTERNGKIASLNEDIDESVTQISRLSQAIIDKDWHIELLQKEIASVYSSRSWRLTVPLRIFADVFWWNGIARIFSWTLVQVRALRGSLWGLGSNIFRRLPLDIRTKLKIRNVALRYLGPRPAKVTVQEGTLALMYPPVPHPSFPDPSARKPFSFPPNDTPLVSVIIPVYNKSDYTYACLRSIYENRPAVSFEIIVVDDCSTDDTRELLEKIEGIQVFRNEDNLGFLQTCNKGAAHATGQYLLFLNNDTLVHPLWMDELVAVLSHRPDIGLVGSQLIYADGRLQESGSLSCQDGSSIPLGRLQSPDHPEFSYFREVDFCSGASILVRKSDFQEIGGFDIAYAPAYYEDPDLAFKMRSTGKKVFVQPLSKVTHFEGISHGEQVYNELVTRNKKTFTNKWAIELAKQAYIDVQDYRVNRRYCRERVLYIDALVPTPDRGAGSVDAYYYMQFLVEAGYDVVFYGEHTPDFVPKYTPLIQRVGVECLYQPHVNFEQYLAQYGATFTYVLVARVYQAEVFEPLLRKYCPNARYIFNTVDVHFLRESRQAEVEKSASLRRVAQRTQENELGFMARADATIVISHEEKNLLEQQYAQERIHHIPLIREIYGCKRPFTERKDIVFIGSAHLPNVDGVLYLQQEILPLIRRDLPEVHLIVIGEELRDALRKSPGFEALASDESISLVGFVENLAEYFDNVRLMVAPLRYGSGVKGKIATALSYGVPCVATRIGVEGMGLEDEINVLEADDPETFARAVVRAYTAPSLWKRLSENGLTFMDENYSLSMGKSRLLSVLASAAKDRKKRPPLLFKRFTSHQDYVASAKADQREYEERYGIEMGLIPKNRVPFSVDSFCELCGSPKPMSVTFDYAHQKDADGQLIPNWREHLVCEGCRLNNRLRASLHLFKELLEPKKTARIYLTEHVTTLAAWLKGHFLNVTTSEYLGTQVPFGAYDSSGVRNESLTALSFPEDSLDFVLSFDVFEHIPDFRTAFSECFRVLAESGALFFSVPFRPDLYEHQIRAEMASDGSIRHLLEPEYHGDPVDPNGGVLCYQVFGWQILDDLKKAGFSEAYAVSIWSREYGYLGGEQILFIARKGASEIGL